MKILDLALGTRCLHSTSNQHESSSASAEELGITPRVRPIYNEEKDPEIYARTVYIYIYPLDCIIQFVF